ncbi:hypothetical protein DFA_05678 [Cavenderia fasciculata]|uniref:Uncharacterized protein n=1 Tax=Cavenderia fasciculata TaxID=261658 RepID=F4PLZ1_CACFS|nr:uncharacterized protein DFA_05678 [Cavenderia fasciculata]EGG23545.1 hypothetical protein DFA_05678 [Cavenderia fasciculata]|eukprot:XP_004361396.1 hypothetical protein DFA_05678 [Cavenderia fasciculata]
MNSVKRSLALSASFSLSSFKLNSHRSSTTIISPPSSSSSSSSIRYYTSSSSSEEPTSTKRTAQAKWLNFEALKRATLTRTTNEQTTSKQNNNNNRQHNYQQERQYNNAKQKREKIMDQKKTIMESFNPFRHILFLYVAYEIAKIDLEVVSGVIGYLLGLIKSDALSSGKLSLDVLPLTILLKDVFLSPPPTVQRTTMTTNYGTILDIIESLVVNHLATVKRIELAFVQQNPKMDQNVTEYGLLGVTAMCSHIVAKKLINPKEYSKMPIDKMVRLASAPQIPFAVRTYIIHSIVELATKGDAVVKIRLVNAGAIPLLEFMASFPSRYNRDYKHACRLLSRSGLANRKFLNQSNVVEQEFQIMTKYNNDNPKTDLFQGRWISTNSMLAYQSDFFVGLIYGTLKMMSFSGGIFTGVIGGIVLPTAIEEASRKYAFDKTPRVPGQTQPNWKDVLLVYSIYPAYLVAKIILKPLTTAWIAATLLSMFDNTCFVVHSKYNVNYYTKAPTINNIPKQQQQ